MVKQELIDKVNASTLSEESKIKVLARLNDESEFDFPELTEKTLDLFLAVEAYVAEGTHDPVNETLDTDDNDVRDKYPAVVQHERDLKEAQLNFLVDIEGTSGLTLMQRAYYSHKTVKVLEEGAMLVSSQLVQGCYEDREAFEDARAARLNAELKKIRESLEAGDLTDVDKAKLNADISTLESELKA